MREVELRCSSGDAEIDRALRGLIGVFETAYPGGIRGYYLTGSYAEGTATITSDVDLTIVFKDGTSPALGEGMPGSGRPGCVCQSGVAHFDARQWPTPRG